MDSQLSQLDTVAAVLKTLGGASAVAGLTGRTPNAVHNWKSFAKFPANTFVVLHDALRAKGFTAPAALWGMVDPRDEATSEAAQ